MSVHIGISHLVFNMTMQIMVGVFLEMEQSGWIGSLRIAAVYMSGVISGSLGQSLTQPRIYIAGASGGVYALIAAHLATIILNWNDDMYILRRRFRFWKGKKSKKLSGQGTIVRNILKIM